MNEYNYWIRTSLGLENVVLNELREEIKINKSLIRHRSIFISVDNGIKNEQKFFKKIRTADDVYKFLGDFKGVDKSKPSIDKLLIYFRKNIVPIIKKNKRFEYFRATVSFLGKRNFNRFFVEGALNELVAKNARLKVLSNEKDEPRKNCELRLRCHIEDDQAFFGVAIFNTPLHRREWRVDNYNAQLHPPIAATMVKVAKEFDEKKIIDPFCGSGTMLIESAIINPNISHYGFDLDAEVINIAKKRAEIAGVKINFFNKSAFDSTTDYQGAIIISNPPWGGKYKIEKNKKEFFVSKLKEIILKSNGAVLVVSEDLASQLKGEGMNLKEIIRTRIRGKLALIVIVH